MSLSLSYLDECFFGCGSKDTWLVAGAKHPTRKMRFSSIEPPRLSTICMAFFCRKHKKADTFHLTFIFGKMKKPFFLVPHQNILIYPAYMAIRVSSHYTSVDASHQISCFLWCPQYEYVTNKTSFELKRSLIWSYKFFCLSAQDALSREFLAIQFMRNY